METLRHYRDHRGSLGDSMATLRALSSRAALVEYLRASLGPAAPPDLAAKLNIEPYARDPRIGWEDTHIVTIAGFGVVGFTDGPLE